MVLEGEIPPGGRIDRRALAALLGVSATPVNEALARLVGERFVERRVGGREAEGFFVPERPLEELAELFAVRAGFEGIAGLLCVERALASPEAAAGLDRICTLFARFELPLDARAEADYLAEDKLFHEGIVSAAGNSVLADIDGNLGCIHRSWARGLVRPPAETLGEHRRIIAAFRARDGAGAQALLVEHNLKTRDRLLGRA
jgi:DNA-binding GntR family transcriptional regulator